MTTAEWIVCEQSGLWAAALHREIARQTAPGKHPLRLREVRSLEELDTNVSDRPDSFVLIEIRRATFRDVLTWLDGNVSADSGARFVALLNGAEFDDADRGRVLEVLLAAGVITCAESPRDLRHVVCLARQHDALRRHAARPRGESQSFSEWAHDLLPWQNAQR